MSRSKRIFIVAVTMILAIGMSVTSVSAAVQAKSIKITSPEKKTYTMDVGKSKTFKAKVSPSSLSKKIVWSSSKKTIATVSSKGKVTAKKAGKTTITAKVGTKKATVAVTVKVPAKTDLPMTAAVKKIQAKANDQYAKGVTEKLAYEFGDDETGFITAGSDAEKAAADYLAGEFKDIGLTDVDKVPVTLDKWQFNDAELTIQYQNKEGKQTLQLTNKNKEIVSYASTGTVQLQDKVDWKNLEIVNLGQGLESNYKEVDVKGKIVLVSVNQNNDFWIDGPYMEAYEQGAAAIITYQSGGYGEFNSGYPDRSKWDTINVQDICAEDLKIPCLSISPANADKILTAMEENKTYGSGGTAASLMADNLVQKDSTAYNVIGKIKGTGNTGQQILYAGHYDKYFEGYQDDAAAIGLTAGIAKSMIDSGFKPVNDIIFIAHCGEEWGQSGTSTDWAIGSWKMITEAKPEWKGKTLAIINFESPAIIPATDYAKISATREITATLDNFVKSDLMKGTENKVFTKPLQGVQGDGYAMTDGVSYQFNGVPVIADSTDRSLWQSTVTDKMKSHATTKYHTQYDNVDTYSPEVMNYKIKAFGSIGAYVDGTPALEMSLNNRCAVLKEAAESNLTTIEQKNAYMSALTELETAGAAYQKQAKALNDQYIKAYRDGKNSEALKAIRTQGTELNKKTLEIFQKSQDDFVGLSDYSTVEPYHQGLENNIVILDQVISALKSGNATEIKTAVKDEIGGLWSGYEGYALSFSEGVCQRSAKVVMNDYLEARNITNWGDRMTPMIPTYKTTKAMSALYEEGKTNPEDYAGVVAEYQKVRDTLKQQYDTKIAEETKAMSALAKFIQ